MPSQTPVAPPRNRKKNKIEISNPFNFSHVQHIGADFNSEDVKRALRKKGVLTEYAEHVQRNSSMPFPIESPDQTYVLPSPSKSGLRSNQATPVHPDIFSAALSSSPPKIDAPTYVQPSEANHYDHILNWTAEDSPKQNIVHYENFETTHTYVNTLNGPKSTKTRRAPSPPSYANKPKLSVTTPDSDTSLMTEEELPKWRKERAVSSTTTPETLELKISTPDRVERRSISPAIQRPDRLFNQLAPAQRFEIGLDDIVPPSRPKTSITTPSTASGTLTKRTMPPPISKQLAQEAQKIFEAKQSVDETSSIESEYVIIKKPIPSPTTVERPGIIENIKMNTDEDKERSCSKASVCSAPTPTESSTPVPKPRTRISLSQPNQVDVPDVIQSNTPTQIIENQNVVNSFVHNDEDIVLSSGEEDDFVCRF